MTNEELRELTLLALDVSRSGRAAGTVDSIKIIAPPWQQSYNDGDVINYAGMVVGAYDAAGELMFIIPHSRLTMPSILLVEDYYATSDLNLWPLRNPIHCGKRNLLTIYHQPSDSIITYTREVTANRGAVACAHGSQGPNFSQTLFASSDSGQSAIVDGGVLGDLTNSFTHTNQTVYFFFHTEINYGSIVSIAPQADGYFNSDAIANAAWTIIFGEKAARVPVSFERSDGVILTDSFDISVTF